MKMIKIRKTLGTVLLSKLIVFGCFASPIDEIAAPVSNPVNFEDPRIESNIKPLFVHHEIDNKFATTGGQVDIYALQLRYAVTDRLALIATKDGFVNFRPNSLLAKDKGFANVAGGVKYLFYKCENTIATAGLRYEAPVGEHEVLQGNGDGIINPFVSAATVMGPINLIGYTGYRGAIDSSDSSFLDASLHADTKIGAFSPLVELNLFHVVSAGDRLPIEDEGQDFFNLGSSLSDGETMLTAAAGARYAITKSTSFGAAYEIPLINTSGSYITDWRLTSDLTFKF